MASDALKHLDALHSFIANAELSEQTAIPFSSLTEEFTPGP